MISLPFLSFSSLDVAQENEILRERLRSNEERTEELARQLNGAARSQEVALADRDHLYNQLNESATQGCIALREALGRAEVELKEKEAGLAQALNLLSNERHARRIEEQSNRDRLIANDKRYRDELYRFECSSEDRIKVLNDELRYRQLEVEDCKRRREADRKDFISFEERHRLLGPGNTGCYPECINVSQRRDDEMSVLRRELRNVQGRLDICRAESLRDRDMYEHKIAFLVSTAAISKDKLQHDELVQKFLAFEAGRELIRASSSTEALLPQTEAGVVNHDQEDGQQSALLGAGLPEVVTSTAGNFTDEGMAEINTQQSMDVQCQESDQPQLPAYGEMTAGGAAVASSPAGASSSPTIGNDATVDQNGEEG